MKHEFYLAKSSNTLSLWRQRPVPHINGDYISFTNFDGKNKMCDFINIEFLLPMLPNMVPGQTLKLSIENMADYKTTIIRIEQ